MKKISLLILSIACLAGCSFAGKSQPIQYFTLNQVKNSCLKSVEIVGPAYLLSEKIMLKKGQYSIGSVNNAYWIAPLQILLSENLSSQNGTKSVGIKIEELSLNVDAAEVVLTATVQECRNDGCLEKNLEIKESTPDTETLTIINAYQKVADRIGANLCS